MKFLTVFAVAVLFSISLKASSPDVLVLAPELKLIELHDPISPPVEEAFATCEITIDLDVTDSNGITTTYKGKITVPMSCKDLVKALMS